MKCSTDVHAARLIFTSAKNAPHSLQEYFLIGNFYRATISNVNISLYKTLDEQNCNDNNGIEPFANRRNLNLCQVCNVLCVFHLECFKCLDGCSCVRLGLLHFSHR